MIELFLSFSSKYSPLAAVALKGTFFMITPLNYLKLLSILPVKIPLKVQTFLRQFSLFVEKDDLNGLLLDPISKEIETKNEFQARNRIFRLNSVYVK